MKEIIFDEFIKFIVLVLKFLSIFGLSFLMLLVSSVIYYQSINFKLQNELGVILGDSQTEAALNDDTLSSYINLASSGTSLLYSYLKIKKIKECNPQIKTLILGIGSRSFEKEKESIWVLNEDIIEARCELIPFETYDELKEYNFSFGFINSLMNLPFRAVLRSLSSKPKLEIFGGYKPLKHNNLLLETTREHQIFGRNLDTSKFELKYLRKIKRFCFKNRIELIVVKLPNYQPYHYYYRPELDIILDRELDSLRIIDYSKLELDSSYYSDIIHMNLKGSYLLSSKLAADLN